MRTPFFGVAKNDSELSCLPHLYHAYALILQCFSSSSALDFSCPSFQLLLMPATTTPDFFFLLFFSQPKSKQGLWVPFCLNDLLLPSKDCFLGTICTLCCHILFFCSMIKYVLNSHPTLCHKGLWLPGSDQPTLMLWEGWEQLWAGYQEVFGSLCGDRGILGRGNTLHGEVAFTCTIAYDPPHLMFPCLLAQS